MRAGRSKQPQKKRRRARGGGAISRRAEAELRRARDQAQEALEQQRATSEILRVISSSPADVGPVFEAIVQSGIRLFEGAAVTVARPENGQVRLMAIAERDPARARKWKERFPFPLTREYMHGVAILDCRMVDMPDVEKMDERFAAGKRNFAESGYRAMTVVPMVKDGAAIGTIAVVRVAAGPLSDKQIALLQTFADQAVIAIENVRMFNETREALERQTATAEVLGVISSSPTNTQPVFEAIVDSCLRLFPGHQIGINLVDEAGGLYLCAVRSPHEETLRRFFEQSATRRAGTSVKLRRAIAHYPDVEAAADVPEEVRAGCRAGGVKSIVYAPLVLEGKGIGSLWIGRAFAGPFADKEISLLKTFADQAVIAIQNVRLFNETKEALDQQKASGEVLSAISSSIADTAPVFDKILESCNRLFAGRIVGLNLVGEDGMLHIGAYHGAHREEFERIFPLPITSESGSGLCIVERRVVHYPDAEHGEDVPAKTKQGCKAIGIKSCIFAPLLWKGRGMGAIFVGRDHVSSFSEKEIALLRTFADQAVIAIENVRLFNETKEALERQTATGEILQVIGSSTTDAQPVFDAIVNSGVRLFPGAMITVARPDGETVRAAAIAHKDTTMVAGWRERFTTPLSRDRLHAAAILDAKLIDFPDAEAEKDGPIGPGVRNFLLSGNRAITIMPMLRGKGAIGAISVTRAVPGPLSDKQIAILRTFADQAVIAIENVRLFNEIQEKSRQLEVASRHKSEFLANMSHELRTPLNAIIGFTRIVMRRSQDRLEPQQHENLEKILASGQHLLALINSILDLAKVEAGRVEVDPGEIGLSPLLESCARTVEPLIKADAVTLVKEFDGILPQMYVDEGKLRQIVINLLSNAAKFTSRGSIRLQAHASNGSVAIAVADTGIGIPSDKLEVIFEEFAQADASSTRLYGGTGLGLTIARRLARLMGGDISAESVLGRGSRFTLTLPLRYSSPGA